MERRALVSAACLLFAAAPSGAQQAGESPAAAPKSVEASEEIVVIGRLPQSPLPPSSVPAAVRVLDAEELRRSGVPGLPDALAGQVPGLSLSDEQGNSYQPRNPRPPLPPVLDLGAENVGWSAQRGDFSACFSTARRRSCQGRCPV